MSKLVENYLLQQPIGKGVYGQVYRATHQKSKQVFAVKVIPKASFRSNPKLQQLAINQINILSSLKHENIVKFVQTLKTPNNFYFVYEYCNQGNLQTLLQKKKFLQETEALIVFRQLLQAFKELNKNNIMHRDLKPDNIFLNNGKVKLGDFGFCKMLQVNMAQTMLGSPIYMAPQILKEQIYTSKADIWSLGVVLFQLLFGFCPYESSSISQLINVIKQNQLAIPKDINPISDKAQTLLKKMLVKDQFKRIEWVDLFQFKIDQNGNILSGYNKQMGIQALERYFLNDVKCAAEILMDEAKDASGDAYHQFRLEEIGSQRNRRRDDQNMDPSLKKVIYDQNKYSMNPLLKSESLGKAGPGPNIQTYEIKQFNSKQHTDSYHNQLSEKKPSSKQKPSSPCPFLQKHNSWSQALELIQQISLSQSQQAQKLIYWVAKQLTDRLNYQYTNYPEWTDVIMQQKEIIGSIVKQLQEQTQNIMKYQKGDKKNQILKIWSKSSNNKNDKNWDKAVRFIFGEETNQNTRTVEEILLS